MKFGKVENPDLIDFTLPKDHPDTEVVLHNSKEKGAPSIYIGCSRWNKEDLKNFYPWINKNHSLPKTNLIKDELAYYSTQFNSIELNASFYRIFSAETHQKWYDKTPDNFKFFPKIVQNVSHLRRLNDEAYPVLDEYLNATANLKDKLGTIFLQMHNNFGPKNWDRVVRFVEYWPKEFRLSMEFRHTDWFNDEKVAQELYHLLQENNISNTLVDTAGRRDIMHMRLTNNEAFIRYVGANHPTDYTRLDDWVEKIADWTNKGLKNVHFFIHQNMELESPYLSVLFIERLNKKLGCNLKVPKTLHDSGPTLF